MGGVPKNFDCSARLGSAPYFVIEADEYDSAFFDKRSKFVHYHPRRAILDNLEFDHADIFSDLSAIQTQFHHLMKTIPGNGLTISPHGNVNLEAVFEKGIWCEQETFSVGENPEADWVVSKLDKQGASYLVSYRNESAEVHWPFLGEHNM